VSVARFDTSSEVTTMNDIRDDVFEARLRVGVPMVRAWACRTWSAQRCACDLDALVDAGAHVLVRAATQAVDEDAFLKRLLRELPSALEGVARMSSARATAEAEARP
jgi:hypothetical protein